MQIQLRVVIGSVQCSSAGLYSSPVAIGRQEERVQFVIRGDRRVSSLHCVLRIEQDAVVVENRSQNGCLVGDYPLMTLGACQRLLPGQRLQVGETLLEISLPPAQALEGTEHAPLEAQSSPGTVPLLATERTLSALRALKRQVPHDEGALSPEPVLSGIKHPDESGRLVGTGQRALSPPRRPPQQEPAIVVTEEVPGALGPRWGGDLRWLGGSLSFGRMGEVLLDDLTLSRLHFRLHRVDQGVEVEDAGSLRGTALNGQRLVSRQPLRDHDVLQAGPFTFRVTLMGQEVLLRARGLEGEPRQEDTRAVLTMGGPQKLAELPGPSLPALDALSAPDATIFVLPQNEAPKEGELRRRTAVRWVPTSDLRRDSRLHELVWATLLGTVLVLGFMTVASGHGVLAPGPVSDVHQAMTGGECSSCHRPGSQDVSLGCLEAQCHPNAVQPLPAGDVLGLPVPWTGIHLSTAPEHKASALLPLACSSCHLEHQGAESSPRFPPSGRCLECHAGAHQGDRTFADLQPFQRSDLLCTACHIQHPRGKDTLRNQAITGALLATHAMPIEAEATPAPPLELADAASAVPSSVFLVLTAVTLIFSPPAGYGLWSWQQRRRRAEQAATALEEAQRKNLPGPPRPQLPLIDPLVCVGCQACVDACPFDALGMVDGVATLVNQPACHGVAICADACPTGAITMASTAAPAHQAPLTDAFESVRVPGIFLIGDISGLSLIKNAINTGVLAAEAIAGRPRRSDCDVDVAIVGAGPAGLSAGLRAAELGLRYALIEQGSVANTLRHFPRSKLVFAQPFDVPLLGKIPMAECTKEQLLALWDALIVRHGLKIHEQETVLNIERRNEGGFRVTTAQRSWTAAQVVVAIGKRGTPRRLGAKGEESEKVLYSLVDAAHYQGKRAFVYGAGDVALETALALASQPETEVTLGFRGAQIDLAKKRNIDKLNAAASAGKIRVYPGIARVQEVRAQELLLQAPEGLQTLPNDVVFACIGAEMPTAWLRTIGVLA